MRRRRFTRPPDPGPDPEPDAETDAEAEADLAEGEFEAAAEFSASRAVAASTGRTAKPEAQNLSIQSWGCYQARVVTESADFLASKSA